MGEFTPELAKANQLSRQGLSFQCEGTASYEDVQRHRAALCAGLIRRFVGGDPLVIDAGCGKRLLEKHFGRYIGVDLVDGYDIEDNIPPGDVVVFMNVLEHVTDLQKVLDNVDAKYVYISVPQEHNRMPSVDHVRHLTMFDIALMKPGWKLAGKWFWTLRPRLWRLRYLFPAVAVYAEDEVGLWKTR